MTYILVVLRKDGQEVGVDAQDDGGATEDEGVECGLSGAQNAASGGDHVAGGWSFLGSAVAVEEGSKVLLWEM